MIIDLHAHALTLDAHTEMAASHPDLAPRLTEEGGAGFVRYPGRAPFGPVPLGMFRADHRLADMQRMGVDLQIVAVPPSHFHYHVDPTVGRDFATINNDALIRLAESHPEQINVFATLPLQDAAAAVAEVERIAANSLVRGVQIGTNVEGRNLDDAALAPVWDALVRHDLPVWVHPDQRTVAGGDRLSDHYLVNLIGNPLETTIAIAAILFSGLLERHEGLRFGFVHGGGFAPFQVGRWRHGWSVRPEFRDRPYLSPDEAFGRLFFDSLTHDGLSLEFLGQRVGWHQVVVGSDYPFDMAATDPVGALDAIGLDAATRRRVELTNAEAFLRAPVG